MTISELDPYLFALERFEAYGIDLDDEAVYEQTERLREVIEALAEDVLSTAREMGEELTTMSAGELAGLTDFVDGGSLGDLSIEPDDYAVFVRYLALPVSADVEMDIMIALQECVQSICERILA